MMVTALLAALSMTGLVRAAERAQSETVNFLAVGDILPDRGIRRSTGKRTVKHPFFQVEPLLHQADLTFGNLEGCLDPSASPLPKKYVFRGDADFARGLSYAGFQVLSLANNHALDGGREGLENTWQALRGQGLLWVGAGPNQARAVAPLFVTRKGRRFAFLAFCGLASDLPPAEKLPASACVDPPAMISAIRRAHGKADFVIVSLHWGEEGTLLPGRHQRKLARALVDAGADLILGHHPHVLQGVEFHRGRPILYSLGNFVFDNPRLEQRQTAVFGCEFTDKGVVQPYLVPYLLERAQPRHAKGNEFDGVVRRLREASQGFAVAFSVRGDRVMIAPQSSSASDSRTKR